MWFFENWLNIARYMADARAQELPLVGGGDHDWANIFGRWGLLAHDTQIAAVVRAIGWGGMTAAYSVGGLALVARPGPQAVPGGSSSRGRTANPIAGLPASFLGLPKLVLVC